MTKRPVPFGERIRQLRKTARLSQEGLAREVGVTVSAVVQIERGKITPSRKTVDGLARVLGVEATQLEGWLREGKAGG